MSAADEPCNGAEGVATPYGAADSWPEFDVTVQQVAMPGEISLAVDGDAHLQRPEYRAAVAVRRLS